MTRHSVSLLSLSVIVFGTMNSPTPAHAQALQPAPPAATGTTPPPPPPAQVLKVFYTVGGQTLGPLDTEQLKAKIAAGEVTEQTLVWMEGMADWKAAATVPAVAPLLPVGPPKAKFDATAFLVGTWEQSGMMPLEGIGQGQLNFSVTYRADGTLSGYGTLSSQTFYGPIVLTISSQGTWTAQAKTDDSFILTPNIQVTTAGKTGVPTTNTSNTPTLITIIDQNTVTSPGGMRSYRTGP